MWRHRHGPQRRWVERSVTDNDFEGRVSYTAPLPNGVTTLQE